MKKISHVEIYYDDSSMERISQEETKAVQLTKDENDYVIDQCLCELNGLKQRSGADLTIKDFKKLTEEDFDIPHKRYHIIINLLEKLK